MTQLAGNPRDVARAFGLKPHHIYRLIKSGAVRSHAFGRRSIVFCADVERALRTLPPTTPPHFMEANHAA
jgi:hypothetical protein